MIPCVERQFNQQHIANVFWGQQIAKVSSITLIPYIKNSEIFSIAYVLIDEWCDSEAAYNFIKRLNNPDREARIVHDDDEWWSVELNHHNNGDIAAGPYTVKFDSAYFASEETPTHCTENEAETDDNEYEQGRVDVTLLIKGLHNDYYTVDEAHAHLATMRSKTLHEWSIKMSGLKSQFDQLEEEIRHFETELRIHEAVINSTNVTLRAHQNSEQTQWRPLRVASWNAREENSNVTGRGSLVGYVKDIPRSCDEVFV